MIQQGVHILQAGEDQLAAGACCWRGSHCCTQPGLCAGLRQLLRGGAGRTCTEVTVLAHSSAIDWLAVNSYRGVDKGPKDVDGAGAGAGA